MVELVGDALDVISAHGAAALQRSARFRAQWDCGSRIAVEVRQKGHRQYDATHGWRFPLDQKHRGKFFGLRHEYPSVLLTKGKRQPKSAAFLHLVETTHCAW